ncbi:MAG: hypothetical protein KDI09_20905 [Halioglobus sp.]|nr:hypothetical protein [Halioglobus sp.]
MLPQFGGQHDTRLPETFDPIQAMSTQLMVQRRNDLLAVPQGTNLNVFRKTAPHEHWQIISTLITDTEHPCAGFGKSAGELRHIGRVTRRDYQYIHIFAAIELNAQSGMPGVGLE